MYIYISMHVAMTSTGIQLGVSLPYFGFFLLLFRNHSLLNRRGCLFGFGFFFSQMRDEFLVIRFLLKTQSKTYHFADSSSSALFSALSFAGRRLQLLLALCLLL